MPTYEQLVREYQQRVAAEANRVQNLGIAQQQLSTALANPTYTSVSGLEAEQGGAATRRLINQVTSAPYKQAVTGIQTAQGAVNQYSTPINVGTPPPTQPGRAWIWNGSAWVKPPKPNDGKQYTWDDDKGWVLSGASTGTTSASQSAYDLLFEQFSQYGLQALIEPLKGFIQDGISPAELTLRLRETDAYKKRFAANSQRIQKGLRALSEAEYIAAEDQYQNVMRQYGLPESYYTRGDMGRQEGFEKFIAGDVSAAELEDRIATAQNRVINAAPEVAASLKAFYPDITNGDILAYVLDPEQALSTIRRKVTAAEIGAGAAIAGLSTDVKRAEELARYGITGEAARQGYQAVAEVLPRGTQLAEFYKQAPYTQKSAEQEVFNLAGGTEYARERKKLSQLEQASFSGRAGATSGALARERAGGF